MQYIAHRQFKTDKTIALKRVNIPIGARIETIGDFIAWKNMAVCTVTSEDAHQYFARNDDGQGMLRGKLTQAIQKALRNTAEDEAGYLAWREKWDKVWSDKLCQRYRRVEHEDHWLWNHDFFNANIFDLYHIAALVGADYKKKG